MTKMAYKNKFIAFIDILGFERIVCEDKISLPDILETLNNFSLAEEFINGEWRLSTWLCPESEKTEENFDLCATQISDSLIVSSEISIFGAINLLFFCNRAVHKLLCKGLMCRGYITRGEIYHTRDQVIGKGYIDAYLYESKKKTTFSMYENTTIEYGTPFVEIDKIKVFDYVINSRDKTAIEMLHSITEVDKNGKIAVFPIKKYVTNSKEEKEHVDNANKQLKDMKDALRKYVDESDQKVVGKLNQYICAIDKQIEENVKAIQLALMY